LSHLPTYAESEFAFLNAAFITCAYVCWDQPSGDSKRPMTLHDSMNEGGFDVRVTFSTIRKVRDSMRRKIIIKENRLEKCEIIV
jgi:hypothetical protein